MTIYEEAAAHKKELSDVRRYLHQHPEASMKEYETAAYIRAYLSDRNIPWVEAGETGTVAVIEGKEQRKVIGLRGDIDALEMDELNDHARLRT